MDTYLDPYLSQSPYSDPGDLDTSELPQDPNELAHLVRGLIIHRLEGPLFGHTISEVRLHQGLYGQRWIFEQEMTPDDRRDRLG
ncbi:hypothetical protein [Streptomyces sp. NPDC001020]